MFLCGITWFNRNLYQQNLNVNIKSINHHNEINEKKRNHPTIKETKSEKKSFFLFNEFLKLLKPLTSNHFTQN